MVTPNEWMDIVKTISKEVVQQYEEIRALGPCNMFDLRCVQDEAELLGLDALASLAESKYVLNYQVLFRADAIL